MADFILVPLFSGPILPGERVQFALETSSGFPEYFGVQFSLTYDADVLTYEGTVFEPPINTFLGNPGEPAGASGATTITGIEGSTLEINGTLVGASRAAVLEFTAKSAADDSAITITPTFALFSDENATLDQIGAPPPVLLDVEPLPLPTVELSASPLAGVEADGTVITLTATASEAVDGDQTVALSLTGDAIAADFGGVLPTEITILDGQTTGSVTVTVADDTEIEADETATFTISSPSAGIELGATTGASVTLESEDVPPPINASFTLVPLNTGPVAPGDTVQFALETSSGFPEYFGVQFSLTYDADVLTYEGTVFEPPINTFLGNPGEPAGASGATTITGIEGSTLEINGTLVGASRAAVLEFTAKSAADDSAITITPTFALFSDENATLDQIGAPPPVLLDVEPLPLPTVELSASPLAGVEADGTVITLTATASEAVDGDQTVALSLTGDAIAADFGGVLPTEITILDGQTTGSVTVTVADDTEIEADETATFTISSPSAGIELGATTGASVTLESEDVPPPINASFTLVPLNTGPVAPGDTVQFALETSSGFPEYFGVQFSLTYDADVLTYEGTVFEPPINTFLGNPGEPAGASGATTITGIEGSTLEINGTLVGASRAAVLEFTAKSAADDSAITITPTFALFSDENATLDQIGAPPPVLLDVEPLPLPTVELSASPLAGVEADGTVITLTATASEAVDGDQTVALSLTGDAIAADFGGVLPTEITILDGQTTGSVTVTVADDTEIEADETATFTISSPSAGIELGATTGASVTLESEDRATGSVTLVPTPGPYNIGETIEIEIVTSAGFPATFGFQSRLAYDADILSFSGVEFLENFDTTSSVTEPEDASGPIELGPLSGASFDGPLPSGDYTAATLSFEVLSTDPVSVDLLPFAGRLFVDENNVDIDLTDPVMLDLVLNTEPDAVNDSDSVEEDGSVEIDVLDNDTDPNTNDTLTIDAFTQGAHGTVTETSGSLTYAPDADFFGTDSFSYTITDGNGGFDTATVDLTVTNVNDAPVGAVLITGTAEEDQTLTADASGLADADGLGAFSYQWFADGTAIAGATDDTLTLGQDQVGAAITVELSYEDGGGTDETVTSDPTAQVANVNDDPTGAVLIDGTVEEGQELTANISGLADEDGLGAFSYQWFAGGTEIAGATGETFTPGQDEVGAELTVEVSYEDGEGTDETVTSAATAPVANVNDDPTGAVLITGTAEEDQTLTADASGLADADGLGAFSYQWFADGTAIAGATDDTLTLGQDQVGAAITVELSYEDGGGTDETVTSDPTAQVANVNDDPTGAVLIDGTVEEGQELTANISGLADEDGLGAFSYQWFAGGTEIAGATGETFTPGQDEVGAELTVEVSYEDGEGTDETVTSAATAPVANVNDDPTGAVLITGTAEEDQTLTADASGLADADGLGAFSYQWFADGTAIAGATDDTLTLGQDQVGAAITVELSYEDGGGTDETVTSDPTAQVANVNDDPTGAVLIDGTVEEGQELTANISGLADEDGLGAFSYQWFAGGTEIAGATGETFTPGQDEVGAELTVEVSYEDGEGTDETVTSAATAPVANVNDDPTGAVLITGTAEEDQTLTADASGLADADGLGAFSYQWFADGTAIAGATDDTLTLGQDQVGAAITVELSYEDGGGTDETVTSDPTAQVANVNDDPTGAVLIDGTVEEGQELTANISGLADEDGLGAFSYQWFAGGTEIAGATGETFTPGQDEVGAELTVEVSYEDGEGTDETVTSAATAPVSDSNEAPIAEDDTASVDEDGSVTIDVLDNDSDPDGGTPAADEVLYRVNVGGPAVNDPGDPGRLVWGGDTGNFGTAGNSPYLFANTGGGSTFNSSSGSSFSGQASSTDPSIPVGTPNDIFQTERYDLGSDPEMQWKFPVQADFGLAAGDEVIVRLYFAELFNGIAAAGERVFDVSVEGAVPAEFDDIDQFGLKGPNVGFMLDTVATLDADGTLDLELIHDVENPALKGIEILTASAPTSGDERFLTVAIDTGPTEGSVVVNPDGTITYTPNADYNGSDNFIYQITDADGATDTATVDIEVDPVNDPPELTVGDEFDFLDSESGLVFTAMATDVDGDTLTFALGGTDSAFFDIDPTSGEVTLSATTPPEFTIADGDIASIADVTQSFDLTVSVTDDIDTADQDVTVNFLKDTDGDGIADAEDNALFVANPDQRDTNNDGYGNIIDADLDNDGFVLPGDLFLFKQAFGSGFPDGDLIDGVDVEANADFNGDGAVTNGDLVIFRNLFGEDVQTLSLVGDAYDTLA